MNSNPASLIDAINKGIESALNIIHTAVPGRIEKYDSGSQKAEVKPLIKRSYTDGTSLSLPVIPNVPVIMPRTATFSLTFPVAAGDLVLLIFCERSLDRWLSNGGEVEPGDDKKHDLSDAIAIPGLYPFTETSPGNGEDVEIKFKDQGIIIKSNGDIEVGSSSLKKLVNEEFQSVFNDHVHNVSTSGSAAAQLGVTSSPAASVGTAPVSVPAVPGSTSLFADQLTDSQLTTKVSAE